MSLYERIDRDVVSPRSKETFEFVLVYAVCFVGVLFSIALRRLAHATEAGTARPVRSILSEARCMAANCAATSFMGM